MSREELNYYIKYFNQQQGQNYPCSNQIVRCAIFTKNKIKALTFMKNKGAIKKYETKNQIQWLFNEELWEWRDWNMNLKGYRFYKVVVDENIEKEFFYHFVLPYCCNYCCSLEVI